MIKKRNSGQWAVVTALWVCLTAGMGGCSVADAVVDGLYGGVRETVAAIVSDALLPALPSGGAP